MLTFFRYCELNVKSFPKYNQAVPRALHNSPNGVIKHIMGRIQAGYPFEKIRQVFPNIYHAKSDSGNEEYQGWFKKASLMLVFTWFSYC